MNLYTFQECTNKIANINQETLEKIFSSFEKNGEINSQILKEMFLSSN